MSTVNQLCKWPTVDFINIFNFNRLIFYLNEDCWIIEGSIVAYNEPQPPNFFSSSSSPTNLLHLHLLFIFILNKNPKNYNFFYLFSRNPNRANSNTVFLPPILHIHTTFIQYSNKKNPEKKLKFNQQIKSGFNINSFLQHQDEFMAFIEKRYNCQLFL